MPTSATTLRASDLRALGWRWFTSASWLLLAASVVLWVGALPLSALLTDVGPTDRTWADTGDPTGASAAVLGLIGSLYLLVSVPIQVASGDLDVGGVLGAALDLLPWWANVLILLGVRERAFTWSPSTSRWRQGRRGRVYAALAIAAAASFPFVYSQVDGGVRICQPGPGSWLWLASIGCAAVAILLPRRTAR